MADRYVLNEESAKHAANASSLAIRIRSSTIWGDIVERSVNFTICPSMLSGLPRFFAAAQPDTVGEGVRAVQCPDVGRGRDNKRTVRYECLGDYRNSSSIPFSCQCQSKG